MDSSQPNILWITLDSVRADHTPLHGYERNTTPEIARVASHRDSVNFKHGISHSTRTPVSVPSMLTGLFPSRHQMIGQKSGDLIPESMATVPEMFENCGYRTLGVSENAYAGEAKGIDSRFNEFIKSSPGLQDFLSYQEGMTLLKYALKTKTHGPGLTLDKSAHGEQNSFFTTDIAKRMLRNTTNKTEPFFCYVHYNDPHHPYIPPLSYRKEYISEIDATLDEAMEFAQDMHNNLYRHIAGDIPFTDKEWEMLYSMYDSVIKYVDKCVGELFEFVCKNFEDTIVVITSDHGDLFGEYGLLGHHIALHDGLTHVPLVTYGLKNVNQCADQPIQHIDVMKTLLSLAGADHSQFQGQNLLAGCREIAISQDFRGTVDDNDERNYDRIRQYNPDIDLSHLPKSLLTAARTRDFKLLHTKYRSELYRLPDESEDVQDQYPSVYSNLLSFVQEWLKTEGRPFDSSPKEAELSDQVEQHLEDMGYRVS